MKTLEETLAGNIGHPDSARDLALAITRYGVNSPAVLTELYALLEISKLETAFGYPFLHKDNAIGKYR